MAFRLGYQRVLCHRVSLQHPGKTFQGMYRSECMRSRFRSGSNPTNVAVTKRTAIRALFMISHIPNVETRLVEDAPTRRRERPGFFRSIQETIVILIRILVIGTVITGLALMYLITRYTHSEDFPIILRKGIELLGPIFIKFGQWASTRKDLFPHEVCEALSQLQRRTPAHSWMYTSHLLNATYGAKWRELFVRFEGESPIGSGCCAQVYKAWVDVDVPVEATQHPRVSAFVETIECFYLGHFVTFLANSAGLEAIIGDKFLADNEEPLADGASARKLKPVAVKVLHPGIKEQLKYDQRDLSIMRGICKLIMYIHPRLYWLSLTDCIDEFSAIMENQVDMTLEARNLLKFSENFSDRRDVDFPRPYLQYTQQQILVESYHEGIPISDYTGCGDQDLQERLARIGMKTILQMIFKDNFIHCDLHPGNMLVQMSSKPKETFPVLFKWLFNWDRSQQRPRIVILDCGLVVSLSERCRRNLQDVFRSVLIGNGEMAADYMMQHSSHVPVDPEGFKSTLSDIVATYRRQGPSLYNVNVSTVVTELFSAMVRHRVKQDGSFSSVILSMMVIEGLGRSLDPNIDVFKEALPFLFAGASEHCINQLFI